MGTVNDVFEYLQRFTDRAKQGKILASTLPEEEEKAIKESKTDLQSIIKMRAGKDTLSQQDVINYVEDVKASEAARRMFNQEIEGYVESRAKTLFDTLDRAGLHRVIDEDQSKARAIYKDRLQLLALKILKEWTPGGMDIDGYLRYLLWEKSKALATQMKVPQKITKRLDDTTEGQLPTQQVDEAIEKFEDEDIYAAQIAKLKAKVAVVKEGAN